MLVEVLAITLVNKRPDLAFPVDGSAESLFVEN